MENTRTVWGTVTLNWDHFFADVIEFQGKSVILCTVDEGGELTDSMWHDASKTIGVLSCLYVSIVGLSISFIQTCNSLEDGEEGVS